MKISKSALFLFELIVVIFLFTVSAAICINIFAKSYSFSTTSEALTMSSLKAETAAEVFKDKDGDLNGIQEILKLQDNNYDLEESSKDEPNYLIDVYYDKDWQATNKDKAYYTMTIDTGNQQKMSKGKLVSAEIVVKEKQKTVFETTAKKFIGR